MKKTQYDILKFIQTSYDDGIVGTQKIKDAFQQVGDVYHYLRWLNRHGFTEETIRKIEGYNKHFYFVTERGRKALEEFESSEVVSDIPLENLKHLCKKYSDITIQFISDKLLLSYNSAWKLASDGAKEGVVSRHKEGREIIFNLVDRVE